ncbi:MAG: XdhC family protein [Gammaproteobacteria bacterium]|nr:XdhC family protein [Gammaproteobacteria bacterium]
MKREVLNQLLADREARRGVALLTGMDTGLQSLLYEDGTIFQAGSQTFDVQGELSDVARRCIMQQRSSAIEIDGSRFIIRAYAPPSRLIIVGAVHIAQALLPMAGQAGFEVYLIDPRTAFGSATRFPGIDVKSEWPDKAVAELSPDASTAVVTLSHDPKIDDPALQVALDSDAFYVGSLGSRKTHAGRLKRLSELGIDDHTLARIHAPIGLPLGGRAPAEIAVSILAQIIEARYSGGGSG